MWYCCTWRVLLAASDRLIGFITYEDTPSLFLSQSTTFGYISGLNQVRVLDENNYYDIGMIGLDVKAIRTQPAEIATKHLKNSLQIFLRLVEVTRSLDREAINELIAARDYEELDWLILNSLMGK